MIAIEKLPVEMARIPIQQNTANVEYHCLPVVLIVVCSHTGISTSEFDKYRPCKAANDEKPNAPGNNLLQFYHCTLVEYGSLRLGLPNSKSFSGEKCPGDGLEVGARIKQRTGLGHILGELPVEGGFCGCRFGLGLQYMRIAGCTQPSDHSLSHCRIDKRRLIWQVNLQSKRRL
jgi:hypothetical protein